jgi:hypothetical protein
MVFVDQNEFYSCLRKSLQRMDLGQSLRDLQVRIAALKAKSEKRLSDQGIGREFPEVKTTSSQEVKNLIMVKNNQFFINRKR